MYEFLYYVSYMFAGQTPFFIFLSIKELAMAYIKRRSSCGQNSYIYFDANGVERSIKLRGLDIRIQRGVWMG